MTVVQGVALGLIGLPIALVAYAYAGYPVLLKLWGELSPDRRVPEDGEGWPSVSISLPVHNEAAVIEETLDGLLALDYPRERLQIVVASDASTDGTDEIVARYAERGVELLRQPERRGKTAAENAAARRLRGEIVVNTDATIRIPPGSLKRLVQAFRDPRVGVASGSDLSVGSDGADGNRAERGYVGYEMWVRALETRVGSIVGASGCFYAIRRELHQPLFPAALSRDFASCLVAREHGFRSVSVQDAICLVPRAGSLRQEFHRKVRTMARGLDTLLYKRHLLNPLSHGSFAWMLASHKLVRWLIPLTLPAALLGLLLLSLSSPLARVAFAATVVLFALGGSGIYWPERKTPPKFIATCGYLVVAGVAGFLAWLKALRGEQNPIWEPTRRSVAHSPEPH